MATKSVEKILAELPPARQAKIRRRIKELLREEAREQELREIAERYEQALRNLANR